MRSNTPVNPANTAPTIEAGKFTPQDLEHLADQIQSRAQALGFQQCGFSDVNLSEASEHLQKWLQRQFHGTMDWMRNNLDKRCQPDLLLPGTIRVISLRMDYRPEQAPIISSDRNRGIISCYASGRDYHKLLRKRLNQLAADINSLIPHQYRAFVDSAPVLERALAEKAGLGWIGKNTMLINSQAGSWFFLGEIFTNLPLPLTKPDDKNHHCGSCTACLDACPTQAIIGPNQVDARRCISYLTIEHQGAIPEPLRPLIGNRIFGCDDCQIVCPWNKFSSPHQEADFNPRHYMQDHNNQSHQLAELLGWSETDFLQHTEGSPLRRMGYENWQRNIAVALGNAEPSETNIQALQQALPQASAMVQEHLRWALRRLKATTV